MEILLQDINKECKEFAEIVILSFYISIKFRGGTCGRNSKFKNKYDGLIINAGGYTHTSVAIHDALKILKIPIIELHITNIYNRRVQT